MAHQHRIRGNRRRRAAKARRERLVGLGTVAGAALALGTTPLGGVPRANADILDMILDPLVPVAGSLAAVDPLVALDPAAVGVDLSSSGLQSGTLGMDAAAAAATSSVGEPFSAALGLPADPLAALASPSDPAALFETLIFEPLHR